MSSGEAELRQRFATRTERYAHRELVLDVLLPRSADALIDESEFNTDERLPYWADLWPSARALARHLLDNAPPGGRVLELGCGVALPSLVLLARGADVLATDYYPDALRFAEVNALRNALPPLRTALMDWRAPSTLGVFDLVLAADVLYERRNADTLAGLLPRVLAPAGRILLADPGRVYLGAFREQMETADWVLTEAEVREEISDPATGAVSRVRIFDLQRGHSARRVRRRSARPKET
ncbi:methyltransferase domain-containing protein [soil metagenome]|nr:methyltransferase domain-containing protein [Gemmatimonadota bacterium]